MVSVLPLRLKLMLVEYEAMELATERTWMLPSTARWFVQFMPAPVTVIAAPLETASLNNLNLSPTISAGPRLDTVSVPVPVLVKMPLTTATSLDGDRDRSEEHTSEL